MKRAHPIRGKDNRVSMLKHIASYVTHLADVVAKVIGIDIEVVDSELVRIAGTGIYADGVGKSIKTAGRLYNTCLSRDQGLFIENPKQDALCLECEDRNAYLERLSVCTPVTGEGGERLGVIGLVCFNDDDRKRVLANREVYVYFLGQIADAIARVARSEQNARRDRRRMEMLLKVADQENSRGVLVFVRDDSVSFINDAARRELDLELDAFDPDLSITVTPTGDVYSHMEEYDVCVGTSDANAKKRHYVVLGQMTSLDDSDASFNHVLTFESKPNLTAMLSSLSGAGGYGGALDAIVGDSPAMHKLKVRVMQIAGTSSTVLITGESGTGKEMFARAVHAASARKDKPFVAINCGAIPDALLESELFGYVKGAFTDASPTGRIGKFELAHQGVLFLDEISSMPLYLQVKLLRVLQERSFTRLGSNKPVHVDIRIIAATNEKLPELIAQKMFREDLYYRLNVIPLELPSLRERMDDIPALAEYFLDRYCRLFGKPPARLTTRLLGSLMSYNWPGNVREFENCIEYMVNMHQGGVMTPDTLPAKISRQPDAAARRAAGASTRIRPAPSEPEREEEIIPLADLEQQAIEKALKRFGDTAEGKKKAAQALGIGIATLYRKIR